MDLNKTRILIAKFEAGTTTIAEEQQLKTYFLGNDTAPEFECYKSLFDFYKNEKKQKMKPNIQIRKPKRETKWLSLAATIVVIMSIGVFGYLHFETEKTTTLGSYKNPETAFKATQKALSMLSKNVNVGIKNALIIQEFENSKNLIFKK